MGISRVALGWRALRLGDLVIAEHHFQKAITKALTLRSAEPTNADYADNLARSWWGLVEVKKMEGDAEKVREYMGQCLDVVLQMEHNGMPVNDSLKLAVAIGIKAGILCEKNHRVENSDLSEAGYASAHQFSPRGFSFNATSKSGP